jgi:hypothetical protein
VSKMTSGQFILFFTSPSPVRVGGLVALRRLLIGFAGRPVGRRTRNRMLRPLWRARFVAPAHHGRRYCAEAGRRVSRRRARLIRCRTLHSKYPNAASNVNYTTRLRTETGYAFLLLTDGREAGRTSLEQLRYRC